MERRAKFLGMRDILDHLEQCYEQWQTAEGPSELYLAEAIKRDLSNFRQLCDSLGAEAAGAGCRMTVAM